MNESDQSIAVLVNRTEPPSPILSSMLLQARLLLFYLLDHPLQPEYLNWKPTEIELRNLVVKKALSRWEEVCTYLGITHEQVTGAHTNNQRNVQQAFFESLMHWHRGCTSKPVNWHSVLDALNSSEMTEVAKNIHAELGKYIELVFLTYTYMYLNVLI